MLIDVAEENQRKNEPIRALTNWVTMADSDNLVKQLKLLDETCPRYDVHNIYAALFPKVPGCDYTPALKRNAELIGRRDALLTIGKLSKMWGFSDRTIRVWFEDEPGCLVIRHPEKMDKRGYTSIRIPHSVAERVYARYITN